MPRYQSFPNLVERNDGYLAKNDGTIVCYTDGCSLGNHQHDEVRFSGAGCFWGWNARSDSIHYPKFDVEYNELNTNQYAEARAILYAARHAQRKRFSYIEIRTDSKFCIKSLDKDIDGWLRREDDQGIWRTQRGTPVKHQAIWEEINDIRDDVDITFQHIYGHQGEEGNEASNDLANQAARRAENLHERECNSYYSGSSSSGYF